MTLSALGESRDCTFGFEGRGGLDRTRRSEPSRITESRYLCQGPTRFPCRLTRTMLVKVKFLGGCPDSRDLVVKPSSKYLVAVPDDAVCPYN